MLSYNSCHIHETWGHIGCGGGKGGNLKSWYGGQVTKRCDHFLLDELSPRDTKLWFSFGNWRRARLDEMIKKWGTERFYINAIFPALYPFWSKFNWLSQRTFIFSMPESQSWKSKMVTKMWRLKRWWYVSKLDYYHHKFDFGNFFRYPVKL